MSYEVGSQYRFAFTVKDDTGAGVDNPTTKSATVTLPDATQSSLTITGSGGGTGAFHADYTFAQEGLHTFSAVTTGPVAHRTDYANAAIYRSIIGLDEARAYIGETDTSMDDILRHVLMSLTEKVESIVGVCVQRRFVNERVPGLESQVVKLKHGPLPTESSIESITSVYPGGPSWVTADFIAYPDSATVELASQLPMWYGPWKATYTAGRLVIPEGIQLALKEALFDFWANQRPFAVDSLEPGMTETAQWETALAGYDMPPHAKSLLEPYEQPGFA